MLGGWQKMHTALNLRLGDGEVKMAATTPRWNDGIFMSAIQIV